MADRAPASWAGGSAEVETYVRRLLEDLHRRGLLADPPTEKSAARLAVALEGAYGSAAPALDLGRLHRRLVAASEVT